MGDFIAGVVMTLFMQFVYRKIKASNAKKSAKKAEKEAKKGE